jgi:hypothetical protein
MEAREVLGKPGQQPFAVGGSPLATLLELDDPSSHLPVGCGQDAVDLAGRRPTGLLE